MTSNTHLSSIFSQFKIVLAVEDRVIEEYLNAAWGKDRQHFAIISLGGCSTVQGVVTNAQKHGYQNVFGLRDRDFTTDNYANWDDLEGLMYVLPRHEVENYLLDWDALASCELNRFHHRSVDEIRTRAEREAGKQTWWLACRECLYNLHNKHTEGFPETPPVDSITDLSSATDQITRSGWFAHLASNAQSTQVVPDLETALSGAHSRYSTELTDGSWVQSFSGKEIFSAIRGYIYSFGRKHGVEPDVDFAKSVGTWQSYSNAVPQEILDLKDALKTRVGI